MKTLVFAETHREARKERVSGTVGYRTFDEFDPKNIEKAGKVIVKGDYPEIVKAYEPKKPVFKK